MSTNKNVPISASSPLKKGLWSKYERESFTTALHSVNGENNAHAQICNKVKTRNDKQCRHFSNKIKHKVEVTENDTSEDYILCNILKNRINEKKNVIITARMKHDDYSVDKSDNKIYDSSFKIWHY